MRYSFFLLLLSLLMVQKSAGLRRPILRARRSTPVTGSYTVVLKDEVSEQQFEKILQKATELASEKRLHAILHTVEKSFTARLSPYSLEIVRRLPGVDYIEEETFAVGEQNPDLPWHLDQLDQLAGSERYDHQYQPIGTGEGVDIYILDTGINFAHTDFEYRAKFSGYDPVDNYDAEEEPLQGQDCHGHGTHIASLAGGRMYGVAKKATLYSMRVLQCNNAAPWSVVLDGLDHVARMIMMRKRPSVVSLSLGGSFYSAINTAVEHLHKMGAVMVVAAGNGKSDACARSPASSPLVITVGATDEENHLYWSESAYGTNHGPCVTLFAPGKYIVAADFSCQNCSKYLTGTSMATPLVSGVAAILLQRAPILSPLEVKQHIMNLSLVDAINFTVLSDEFRQQTSNRRLWIPGSCGGFYPIRTHGHISSPSLVEGYSASWLRCHWLVEAQSGQEVELQLEESHLEEEYDMLVVCDGPLCLPGNILAHVTGHLNHSLTLRSSGPFLSVMLSTDGTVFDNGFNGSFTKLYAGTPLKVPDAGLLLPEPETSGTIDTHSFISKASDSVISTLSQQQMEGFQLRWIASHQIPPATDWYYDLIFDNSSKHLTRAVFELSGAVLNSTIINMARDGYMMRVIASRYRQGTPLYSGVFQQESDLIETAVYLHQNILAHYNLRINLKKEGWQMKCQDVTAEQNQLRFSSIYVRDRRKTYNITVHTPDWQSFYGFNFYQFMSLTLQYGLLNYFPRHVTAYLYPGETESRFAVIYERKVHGDTDQLWYRWGLNATTALKDIDMFNPDWDPVLIMGYKYKDSVKYMIQWGRKIPY